MKLWKPKEKERLAQGHKIVTLLAQALYTKTVVGGERQGPSFLTMEKMPPDVL